MKDYLRVINVAGGANAATALKRYILASKMAHRRISLPSLMDAPLSDGKPLDSELAIIRKPLNTSVNVG